MKSGLLLSAAVAIGALGFMGAGGGAGGAGSTTSPSSARVAMNARYAIDEVMPEVNVDGIGIGRVIDYLRGASGANIVVDWNTLEALGVGKDAQVTMQVRGVTLRKLLELAFNQASPTTQMVVTVDQNVIEVTTQEAADRKLVTRTYSVADLVLSPAVTQAPVSLNISQATQQGSSGGGGGSGLITDNASNGGQGNMTQQQMGDQLVTIIRTMVRPAIWTENGGQGSISYFMGQLVVTAPVSVQDTIGGSVESSGGAAERFGF